MSFILAKDRLFRVRTASAVALCIVLGTIAVVTVGPFHRQNASASGEVSWQRLSDGSWLSTPTIAKDFKSVTRCWKARGSFDCLNIFSSKDNDTATRFQSARLDRNPGLSDAGYRCMAIDRYFHESVSKDNKGSQISDVLKSNNVEVIDYRTEISRYWTRDFVDNYMKQNQIIGNKYFNCPYVMSVISNGSYLSVGTTDLTYQQMLGSHTSQNPKISSGSDEPLSGLSAQPAS